MNGCTHTYISIPPVWKTYNVVPNKLIYKFILYDGVGTLVEEETVRRWTTQYSLFYPHVHSRSCWQGEKQKWYPKLRKQQMLKLSDVALLKVPSKYFLIVKAVISKYTTLSAPPSTSYEVPTKECFSCLRKARQGILTTWQKSDLLSSDAKIHYWNFQSYTSSLISRTI